MPEQPRLVVAPIDGKNAGSVPIKLVRVVAGFVAQYELLAPPPFAVGDDALGQKASYRAGDVVYCRPEPGLSDSDNGQVAVFLADTPESRPAYPVIGHATTRDVLRNINPALAQTGNAVELVDEPFIGELVFAPVQ